MVRRTRLVLVLALLLLPWTTSAQPVPSFERLADRLNAGDRVRVVDAAGREHTGPVVTLSPDVIADTLGALLKYQDDIARLQGSEAKRLLDAAKAAIA